MPLLTLRGFPLFDNGGLGWRESSEFPEKTSCRKGSVAPDTAGTSDRTRWRWSVANIWMVRWPRSGRMRGGCGARRGRRRIGDISGAGHDISPAVAEERERVGYAVGARNRGSGRPAECPAIPWGPPHRRSSVSPSPVQLFSISPPLRGGATCHSRRRLRHRRFGGAEILHCQPLSIHFLIDDYEAAVFSHGPFLFGIGGSGGVRSADGGHVTGFRYHHRVC